ncbi:MAG: DUF2974 domain-containing protein [Ruminococcus sp.]|nr:DUF2974 domain-containing protein [Ruminococcus sp.]
MANVFDYLQWRGDLLFSQDGFHTADALILSRLSYIQLDGILGENESLTVRKAAEQFFADETRAEQVLWKGDAELLQAAAQSARFGDLVLSDYVNIVDGETKMQFSAVVIDVDGRQFLSYRGTDNTVVGWQEDFALFTQFPLPSQIKALTYFEKAAARFDGRFMLGGHSKGGNLAVYAAAFCEQTLRDRIDAVYSMDGPGFERENLKDSAFDEIRDRIHTFVPQSSVFGMLLEHRENYTIIQSDRKGFMQHDIYSWNIDGTEPVTLPKTTATSAFFDHTITDFFDGMSREDRKRLLDGVFDVLKSSDVTTFDEMLDRLMPSIGKGLDTMKNMDGKTRALIMKQVGRLVKSAGRNLSDVNPLRRKNRLTKEERDRLKLDKRRFKHEKKLREITGEAGS